MQPQAQVERVVVTGLGAVTPIGLHVAEYWSNLTAGVSGVGPITSFDTADLSTKIGAEVKGFDPREYMEHKEARRTHRSTHFALAAARQAIADAGLVIDAHNAGDVGVVINTGGGGTPWLEDATKALMAGGPRKIGPFTLPAIMLNAVACQVSIAVGAKGPLVTSTLACASGSYALLEAMQMLQSGEAQVMIAGGTESAMSRLFMAAFCTMGALSKRNDDPVHASRPFDRTRDGFVYGEGAAILVLETESHARARGASVYAELAGGSITSDAYHITAPDPQGDGARRAMTRALARAGMGPEGIDVVFAHGTSTQLNDATETRAIKSAFGDCARRVAITGTKSMTGHLFGAAGSAAAVPAVLAIRDGVIPPTINLENPDPECDLDYVPHVARHTRVNAAMVNAFGFGGQNVVLVFRRYRATGST